MNDIKVLRDRRNKLVSRYGSVRKGTWVSDEIISLNQTIDRLTEEKIRKRRENPEPIVVKYVYHFRNN